MNYSQERPFETQTLKNLYDDRLDALAHQLQVFFSELENDEIFKAMQENHLSKDYSNQRAAELFKEIMQSEQEDTILRLQHELTECLCEKDELKSHVEQLNEVINSLQIRLNRYEADQQLLESEYNNITGKLQGVEDEFKESLKQKEEEYCHLLDLNTRKMEATLMQTEQKYFVTKKELENLNGLMRVNEALEREIEALKREMKAQQVSNQRVLEDMQREFKEKTGELSERVCEKEKVYENSKDQYLEYKNKSEELAENQQTVIRNLAEKSKALKQKVIKQKSRLEESARMLKEGNRKYDQAVAEHEKVAWELEGKVKAAIKEGLDKEAELLAKQQKQILQLQQDYQQMMNLRLSDIQKEADTRIAKSKEHDAEVTQLMEQKFKELDRDFMKKSLHDQLIKEKEALLLEKYSKKLEELTSNHETHQNDLKSQIFSLKQEVHDLVLQNKSLKKSEESLKLEILREKERLSSQLNSKFLQLKDSEFGRTEVEKELSRLKQDFNDLKNLYDDETKTRVKSDKEIENLNATLKDLSSAMSNTKKDLHSTIVQHEQVLSDKVDRILLLKEEEKTRALEKELANKAFLVLKLEKELQIAHVSLKESTFQRSEELNQLELERSRHLAVRNQLKDLEDYSQKLLNEAEYQENQCTEANQLLERYKKEVHSLAQALEVKDQDILSLRRQMLTKESEHKAALRSSIDKTNKFWRNSLFFLKKQLKSMEGMLEHEVLTMTKSFSSAIQEISIKIIELQSAYRHQREISSASLIEDLKSYYRSKFSQLEEFIKEENFHWNDGETEGIRKCLKGLIEKKHLGQVEIQNLKETLAVASEQNESLYRENQRLQIKLHANNEAFDHLQREVAVEASRLKFRIESKERGNYSARTDYRN